VKIAKVLGTDELYLYLEKYDIELDSAYDDILQRYILILQLRYTSSDAILPIRHVVINANPGHASSRQRTNVTSPTKLSTFWTSFFDTTTRSVSPLGRLRITHTSVSCLVLLGLHNKQLTLPNIGPVKEAAAAAAVAAAANGNGMSDGDSP
jgi:hypothetical protein